MKYLRSSILLLLNLLCIQSKIGLDEIQKFMEVISINEYLYPETRLLGE